MTSCSVRVILGCCCEVISVVGMQAVRNDVSYVPVRRDARRYLAG